MNKGTVRVLNALNLFAQQPTWGVTELSRELKCSKNSAFQALDTLLKEGYLVRSSSGPRYQLAHKVLNFGSTAESTDVRSLCHPTMQRIHELTSESVFLAILVGRSCVCIDSIQTQGVTVGYSPLSQPLPLHAGTGARLLLAYLKDEEIERYIALESPLRGFTPTTITDPKELWSEVRLDPRSTDLPAAIRIFRPARIFSRSRSSARWSGRSAPSSSAARCSALPAKLRTASIPAIQARRWTS